MFTLIRRLFSPGALFYAGALCLVGFSVAGGVFEPSARPATQVPDAPQPMGAAQPAGIPAAPDAQSAHPLEEPLRLLAQAQQTFQGVRDYTCTLVKQERIDGKLQEPNVMSMMVRNEPFSVYLKWHQPKAQVGQEACYVAGRHGGKMRAKSPGLLRAVGFVTVDPNDPRARKMSNHSITEAGIGNLLARYARRWQAEYRLNRTQVQIGEYEYAQRRCIRVETIHPERIADVFAYYRNVVYFDQETTLPVRVECYDWPRPGSPPGGELLEVYSYLNLRFNVNLPDEVFNR